MIIYLAGGATGNNNHIWRDNAKSKNLDEPMKIFLAGTHAEERRANSEGDFDQKISILESFYYMQDWMIPYIREKWDFLLDSGAFTFMSDKKNKGGVDWMDYLKRYINFINENDIKLFFELDIDSIVGLKEVEKMRSILEKETGKKSIPVWHKNRGLKYYEKMCDDYDYIAIGASGQNDSKWTRKGEESIRVLNQLCDIASKKGAKVHGLGFTSLKDIERIKFYSVDSTAWLYGNRGGFLYYFNGITLIKENKPKGFRMNAREVAVHNFREWVKFQQYAKNLR